ncbi:MAG: hypothetical protein ABI700_02260 [Chloroflexota bacterium]
MARFGEVLGDVLSEQRLSQKEFASLVSYHDSVVSRLINNPQLPRWVDFREVKRMTLRIGCTEAQVGKLIVSFICDSLRGKGLDDA